MNLWVTDGTSAGTSELAIAGANSSGLNPSGITVFATKALFKGADASGRQTLWVTDGTSAGTREITNAGGNPVLSPKLDFAVLGNKALFPVLGVGLAEIGQVNLWVTDGTLAGTSELTVAGASSGGLFHLSNTYVDPQFTVLGTKALFVALDASNRLGLWVTDGTSAGTSELIVAGANSRGLFYTGTVNFFPNLTVLGGRAVFAGFDAASHVNLWVTDGTAAGTSELSVAAAAPSGLIPSDITVAW